jgi:GT2 family glycosyltransferase
MTLPEPTISIVITCYREGRLLERAIESVERQTDRDFEVLVVNDASTDEETNRVCRSLEGDGRARVVWREENGGLSAARNSGYEHMRGDVCMPLDADDTLPPDCVGIVREVFASNPRAGFVFGNYVVRAADTGEEQVVDCSVLASNEAQMEPRKCLRNWKLLGVSPCRKSTWGTVGGFDEEFSYGGQDVDFWMKVFRSSIPGAYVGHTLYTWFRDSAGMNARRTSELLNKANIMEKNLATFDAFELGEFARRSLMKAHLLHGNPGKARQFARELIRKRDRSLAVMSVVFLPARLSKSLYRLRKARIQLNANLRN